MLLLLQKALNSYLALDPESSARLSRLQGKRVAIELLNIDLYFQLYFTETKIELKPKEDIKPDTIIKGTPLSLLHMTLARDDRKRFFAEDVTIEGNIDLGQQVIDLFDAIEIDWEEYASRWMGDVSAHQLGRLVRRVTGFSARVRQTTQQNINEYVHEEINLFPPKESLQDFFHDIDLLRMDVDRLEARIEKIVKEVSS